jgi:hypothetical protein
MPDPCLTSSPRIALTLIGTPHALSADVILSLVGQNGLVLQSDGLWAPSRGLEVTDLPTSANDGDEIYYVVDASNGIVWNLRYNASSGSAFKWEFIGGSALSQEILTSQSIAGGGSGAYQNLGTTGPDVTVPENGDYDIHFGARISGTDDGSSAKVSPKLGALTTNDNDCILHNYTRTFSLDRKIRRTLSAGDLVRLQYANQGPTAAATFVARFLFVTAVRLG